MRNFWFRSIALPAVFIALMGFQYSGPATSTMRSVGQDLTSALPPNQCSIANNTFQDGEVLTYKLYYNWNFVWMAAGEVTFRAKDLGDRYHISAIGTTYKSYEWFYKVRDRYEVYLDKNTLLPISALRDVEEGKYRLYDKITFDRKRNVVQSMRGKSKESAELTEYTVDPCMHDILSIVYFSRNLDFSSMNSGAQVPIKIFIDKETWPLRIKYLGKVGDKRIHKLGRFKTIVFTPQVIKGYIFKDDDQLKIWASDDKNRIPLMIESPISVGSVKAVLKSYNGLKYNLDAKILKADSGAADPDLPQ